MTRCRDVARLASLFVDGELDPERASALRGHARQCPQCKALLADEARVRDLAHELEPLDPPASLWTNIDNELARAESADAARSRLWLWWQGARSRVASAGLIAATVGALLFWWYVPQRGRSAEPVADAPVPASVEPVPAAPPVTHEVALVRSIAAAEARYRDTVAELEELLAEERGAWSSAYAARVDARADALAREIERLRVQTRGELLTAGRDQLFAAYSARIAFLQDVALAGAEVPK